MKGTETQLFLGVLIFEHDKTDPNFCEKLKDYTKGHNSEAIKSIRKPDAHFEAS
jgi:hypothetical protein